MKEVTILLQYHQLALNPLIKIKLSTTTISYHFRKKHTSITYEYLLEKQYTLQLDSENLKGRMFLKPFWDTYYGQFCCDADIVN